MKKWQEGVKVEDFGQRPAAKNLLTPKIGPDPDFFNEDTSKGSDLGREEYQCKYCGDSKWELESDPWSAGEV